MRLASTRGHFAQVLQQLSLLEDDGLLLVPLHHQIVHGDARDEEDRDALHVGLQILIQLVDLRLMNVFHWKSRMGSENGD